MVTLSLWKIFMQISHFKYVFELQYNSRWNRQKTYEISHEACLTKRKSTLIFEVFCFCCCLFAAAQKFSPLKSPWRNLRMCSQRPKETIPNWASTYYNTQDCFANDHGTSKAPTRLTTAGLSGPEQRQTFAFFPRNWVWLQILWL